MKNNKIIVLFTVIVIIIISATLLIKNKKTDEVIKIGYQNSPAMSLLMVAEAKNYWAEEKINVELVEFTAGKFALEAFISNSLDFAVSGDVPVHLAHLQNHQFKVYSQIVKNTNNEMRIVVNNNGETAGSSSPEIYFNKQKRKIGTSIGGGPEFFTYQFIKKLNLPAELTPEIISLSPQEMPFALESKSVDAISIFDPFAYLAEKNLGDKASTFIDSDLYRQTYILVGKSNEDKEKIGKILKALTKAEEFINKNPAEAQIIVSKKTGQDIETIKSIWDNFEFGLSLNKNLITNWEKQTDWLLETGKVKDSVNKLNQDKIIDSTILEQILPNANEL